MRLLVTRPEPDGARTAAELRARGHQAMLSPLLRVETLADVELGDGPWAAVLLTSANGARAVASHRRRDDLIGLPALAVGRSSADAACAAGFADAASADGDALALVSLAAARFAGRPEPLLYLAGEDRARDLAADLAAKGLAVRTVVVYRTVKAKAFDPDADAALRQGAIDGVLHFSRRSVEHYLDCAGGGLDAALAPTHYCLSERAAAPLWAAGAPKIRIAAHPDEAALLDLLGPA